MQNGEHDILSKKYVQKKPAPAPKIKVSFKLYIQAYISHSPLPQVKLDKEYVKKLSRSTLVTPFLTASTTDTGAQVIILGHTHLSKMGLNISCLHSTDTIMDCADDTATGAMGVCFGCVRGKLAPINDLKAMRQMKMYRQNRQLVSDTCIASWRGDASPGT